MNKTKIIIVTVVVAILVAILGWFLVPRVLLHMSIKAFLPECKPGTIVTDFTGKEENPLVVSNQYFSVEIPEGYVKREGTEKLNVSIYESEEAEKNYMIFDYPSDLTMSLLDPLYYGQDIPLYGTGMDELEEAFVELGYAVPDSYYNTLKAATLLNEEDYSFWDMNRQVVFSVLGTIRVGLYEGQQLWLYENEDVCAVIRQPEGTRDYIMDVMKAEDLNIVYGFYIKNAEEEDAWKFLNSIEWN